MENSRHRSIAYLCAVFLILASALVLVKSVYVNWDPETGQLAVANALFDDGGCYVSELHVHNDRAQFEAEPWFQAIRDQVTVDELRKEWGPHGPRVKYIFSSRFMGLYFHSMLFANGFVDDINRTYTLSLLVFPALLILKLLLLLFLVSPRWHLPVIAFNLAHDVLNVPAIAGSEHMAVQLLLIGIMCLYFGRERPWIPVVGWLFAGLACLFNPLVFGPVLAVLVAQSGLAQRTWQKIQGRFLVICLSSIAAILVIQFLQLSWSVLQSGAHGTYNHGVTLFVRNLVYLDLGSLVMLFLLARMRPDDDGVRSSAYERLKSIIVLIYLGAILVSLLGPLVHFEIWENTARLQRYAFIFQVTACALLLPELFRGDRSRWVPLTLLLVFLTLSAHTFLNRVHPGQSWGWSMKVHHVQRFDPDQHLPRRAVDENNGSYFVADNAQKVYGYFIQKHFKEGPLVLEILSKKYNSQTVLDNTWRNTGQNPSP